MKKTTRQVAPVIAIGPLLALFIYSAFFAYKIGPVEEDWWIADRWYVCAERSLPDFKSSLIRANRFSLSEITRRSYTAQGVSFEGIVIKSYERHRPPSIQRVNGILQRLAKTPSKC